jgi:L-lactate dehydrogenase (cytochrome)
MRDVVRLLFAQLADAARSLVHPRARRAARLARHRSILEIREAARRALPKVIFEFVDGAAADEVTMRRNAAAFDRWSIVPRVLVDVSDVNLTTTILGRELAMPVLGAPTGLCGLVHRDGERALAAGLAQAGSVYALAAMSSYSLEEVRQAAPEAGLWFQTYLWRDRDIVADLVDRAEAARYEALVVTVDVPRSSDRRRDRLNQFGLPPRITSRTFIDGIRNPRWTRDFLLHPRITAANVAGRTDEDDAVSVAAYVDRQFDPSATWDDLAWLRERWNGPLVIKGILSVDDAKRSVDVGADALVVSNHGGRQLDQAPATLDVLPDIAAEVGHGVEILVDGGIRRGSDVIKALALGARACLVGRPIVYGLGMAGETGVASAMRVLEDELRAAMMLAGITSVSEMDARQVVPVKEVAR